MPTTFPATLDTPNSVIVGTSDFLDTTARHHGDRTNDHEDRTIALEAKVGADSSAVVTSLDYLRRCGSSNLAARDAASAANAGQLWRASNVHGGVLYRSNGATWDQVAPSVADVFNTETTYTGTTAAETVIATWGSVRANELDALSVLRLDAIVVHTLISSATARSLTLRIRMGGLAGVILIDSGAQVVSTSTSQVLLVTLLQAQITMRTIGASATCVAGATMPNKWANNAGVAQNAFANVAFAVATFDSTVTQSLVLTAQETVSNTVADLFKTEGGSMMMVA
jgi:hypothetical protein